MKTSHLLPSLAAALATAWLLAACQSTKPQKDASLGASTADSTSTEKSGTQLWAENCTRCHGNRSPAAYSDSQWAVAMMHMRVRANLTAEEHRKILEFLQSAN